jgi:hypothetical protein
MMITSAVDSLSSSIADGTANVGTYISSFVSLAFGLG